MCSEIFSRKINYSSCNLSFLKTSQSVRFSEKLFWSKMTLSDFLTVSLRANPELSIFWRVLLAESAFSDFQSIRFWRKESRLKIKSEQGAVKIVLKERIAEFSQRSTCWQFFSCLLRLFWWRCYRVSTPFPFFWLVLEWWDWLWFPTFTKREYKKTRLDFQPSLFV